MLGYLQLLKSGKIERHFSGQGILMKYFAMLSFSMFFVDTHTGWRPKETLFITARIRRMGEGTVFTGVCP